MPKIKKGKKLSLKEKVVTEVEVEPEEVTPEPEVDHTSAIQKLASAIELYEIPESFEGHVITSIIGMRTVGSVVYIVAYCDDRCTYDVPVELKKE